MTTYQYAIQVSMIAVSISKNHISNLGHFFKNRIDGYIDSVMPAILKEQDFPIVNDRLLLTVVVNSQSEIKDEDWNKLKEILSKDLKEYFESQNIICNSPHLSISRL